MKLYFAGAEGKLRDLSKNGVENILISMATKGKKIHTIPSLFSSYNLMLDSGAFTFGNKNIDISVDNWIEMVYSVREWCSEVISLDVIGNAEKSYQNYIEIKKSIPDAVPTFHLGSNIKWLKKYIDNTNRICIGGMVYLGANNNNLFKYLDEIFSLFSFKNYPKLHSFGVIHNKILTRYPFYSADSTTWMNFDRFGSIVHFNGKDIYQLKSIRSFENLSKFEKLFFQEAVLYGSDDSMDRLNYSINSIRSYEEYLTNLWKERGVEF